MKEVYHLLLNLALTYGTMNRDAFMEKVEELAAKYNLDGAHLDQLVDVVLAQLQQMRFRNDLKNAFSAAIHPETEALQQQIKELSAAVTKLSEEIRELKGGKE